MRGFTNIVKLPEREVPIDPCTICRSLSFNRKAESELNNYCSFELALYPSSLFAEQGMMRKSRESVYYDLFNPVNTPSNIDNAFCVNDGGFLLHRVTWKFREKLPSTINKYVEFPASQTRILDSPLVGEDIELLVITTDLAPDNNLLFLMKPGKKTETIFYSSTHFKMSKKVKDNTLFLHSFNGCDLTSAIFRQGKMKFIKLLDKDSGIQKAAEVFKNHHAATAAREIDE
ncbi:hypothetical protein AVEN_250773-1 [Araneus ventricosus]|uniref:Uncharacterized protein n=1 Tax=Araneus ventricosus TaxID=182803 RepID=A0A4Y2VYR3_ARAVE|nr:hypothetical protein AVEN_250773-1 [Araneus ventricosus]